MKRVYRLLDVLDTRLRYLELQAAFVSGLYEGWVAAGPGAARREIASVISGRLLAALSLAEVVVEAVQDLRDQGITHRQQLRVINRLTEVNSRIAHIQCADVSRFLAEIGSARSTALRCRPPAPILKKAA
jgi:hypothetical protein